MFQAAGEKRGEPNAGRPDMLGEASRARLQAALHCLPHRTTALCSRPTATRQERLVRETTEARRNIKMDSEGPSAQNTYQHGRLQNKLGAVVRDCRKEGRKGSFPCRTHRSPCHIAQERFLDGALGRRYQQSRPDRQKGGQKGAIMRLARVEQAAFGTGIRRASHCATTPLAPLSAFWGQQSIRSCGIGGMR